MTEIKHLRALQAFDRAASRGTLSRAAEELGVTHGAVSRQVKQLEQHLGVELLRRGVAGVEVTAAGERLHLATQQAFATLRDGIRGIRRQRRDRVITLSLSASLATKWLVPKLPDFRARHPGISMFLDTNDEVIDFADSDVDVALRYGIAGWQGLQSECLASEDLVVVASPALLEGRKPPLKAAEIAAMPRLLDRFNPAWDSWAAQAGLASSDLSPARLEFADSAVLIGAALDGQGVALARRLLVRDDLEAGRLVRLDETSVRLERQLYFVCRPEDRDRHPIRLLENWLKSQCADGQ